MSDNKDRDRLIAEQQTSDQTEPEALEMGILSFITSLVVWILWCAIFIFMFVNDNIARIPGVGRPVMPPGWLVLFIIMTNLAALSLGIRSLRQRESKKIFAILGIIFSSLFLVYMFLPVRYELYSSL